ncbi:DUF1800 domain-containing protein [Hymenobacter sp. ASUV-10]|uniref:DUF1800 domain-containing protein n=1 Tax=Hymenobacter aranciens TaxID=3063996 RepID=A0ABT9B4A5_9BACT|nr:DUF1800 domain-containing protein [Hymenobacter sp. ASUV-10]MDO7873106.1 DUF1800 domain-containing protein [Hymenobacter sp. ASUV-10]
MKTNLPLQHLYWRAGFGPRPQDVAAGRSPRQALRQLLKDAAKYEPLTILAPLAEEGTPMVTADGPTAARRAELTPEQRKARNLAERTAYQQMTSRWLARMASSPAQLREKMTLFWHGHFACRVRRPEAALRLHNTTRRLALGKFPDLLLAVSREPAMLQFLNNQQNKKQHPNENFAREVMELFTLGRGNYSEQDVKEAARAFTGWGADAAGNFQFRPKQHDDGPKTFLGRTGNFTGEDVLRIILEQPAAATFLTTKLYCFFVNEVPNPAHIAPLATSFRRSGYDITALLEALFGADWFYDPANVGAHLKSPVELVAGLRRTLNLQLDDDRALLGIQKALGQTLFMPPNVAGWPGGRSWIDSSSLLLRLQLPSVLFKDAEFAVTLKQDEDDLVPNLTRAERKLSLNPRAHLPLAPLQKLLGATPAAGQLAGFLLQVPVRAESLALVQQAAAQAAPAERLKVTLVGLLSLPEYQLA